MADPLTRDPEILDYAISRCGKEAPSSPIILRLDLFDHEAAQQNSFRCLGIAVRSSHARLNDSSAAYPLIHLSASAFACWIHHLRLNRSNANESTIKPLFAYREDPGYRWKHPYYIFM